MEQLIQAMKAAGEPTRLRILMVLHRSELTVSELCRILGQSQPRVSRHLKLLCEAGLLHRQAEGTSAYYRYADSLWAQTFLGSIRPLTDLDSQQLVADRRQLDIIRAERAELAARSERKVALEEALLIDRRVSKHRVEEVMLDAVEGKRIGSLLDIGTGTGRVLQLFAPHIESGLGIELSREMLNLARTTLDADGYEHCAVRHGNAYNLDVADGSVDLAVLHHVLHFLDEPSRAIDEAARKIDGGGQLLIVDFAPHGESALQLDHGHRRLGFADDDVASWCRAAGLVDVDVTHLAPPMSDPPGLTVTVWRAAQRADALSDPHLEMVP
ncbi:MAG: metalloregulator ArsR/SmtB family transcription factor [Actinomycetota bacterium]